MYGQPGLFDEPPPPVVIDDTPPYDHEPEAQAFRDLGGPFASDQLGIATISFGDGLTRRFRFIYNPNQYSCQRLHGPSVEIFGLFGYRDMDVSLPDGRTFDEWMIALLDGVKLDVAGRFASKDHAVFTQSAQRQGMTAKLIAKMAEYDDTSRANVRNADLTPVEITEITYEPTEYRSHYEIPVGLLYFGFDVAEPDVVERETERRKRLYPGN